MKQGHYAKWNKSDRERLIIYKYIITCGIQRCWTHRTRAQGVVWNGPMLVTGYKIPGGRWVNSEHLTHSIAIIINDTVLCTWKLRRE